MQFETAKFAFEILVDRSAKGASEDLECVESTIAAEKWLDEQEKGNP